MLGNRSQWFNLINYSFVCCLGDSDEKSKRGPKRKKPPPSAIENDFLPKRRSARVWLYPQTSICLIIVLPWKTCKNIITVSEKSVQLFMKKKKWSEECLFAKLLALSFLNFLFRWEQTKRRRRKSTTKNWFSHLFPPCSGWLYFELTVHDLHSKILCDSAV